MHRNPNELKAGEFMYKKLMAGLVCSSLVFAQPTYASQSHAEAQNLVQKTHETAREIARSILLRNLATALFSVQSSIQSLGPSIEKSKAKDAFANVQKELTQLNDEADQVSLDALETELLEELSRGIKEISDEYRMAQTDWLVAMGNANKQKSTADLIALSAVRLAQDLTDLCEQGVAMNVDRTGMPVPVIRSPELGLYVNVDVPTGGGANGVPQMHGEPNGAGPFHDPFVNALFLTGASLSSQYAGGAAATAAAGGAGAWGSVASVAAGTGAAIVVAAIAITAVHMIQNEENRKEMRERTDAALFFYKNAAGATEVQKYYREACAPHLERFKKLPGILRGLQSLEPTEEAVSLKVLEDSAKVARPKLDELIAVSRPLAAARAQIEKQVAEKLGALDTEEKKQAFVKEVEKQLADRKENADYQAFLKEKLGIKDLFEMVEFVLLSLTKATRDSAKNDAPVDEVRLLTFEKLEAFDLQLHNLRAFKYRLSLLKQDPVLVKAFEDEVAASSEVRELYRMWVGMVTQAMSSSFVDTVAISLSEQWEIWSLVMRDLEKERPFDPAVMELAERGQILKEFLEREAKQ